MDGSPRTLRIFLRQSGVSVLGPGRRAVIWTQCCSIGCKGCISRHSWNPLGGQEASVEELAGWILEQTDIEGVTFSGGEPMDQAAGLSDLMDTVRGVRDMGVVCYTGYTLEHLREKGSKAALEFLSKIDLLIDGPYVENLHADLLWRASSNQRLILLSERYREALEMEMKQSDSSRGLEIYVSVSGGTIIAGVPSEPGFADSI